MGSNIIPRRVIVAEDDPVSMELICRYLRDTGHEALEASSGLEAIGILQNAGAENIISDWFMPNLSGLDLCKLIRGNPEFGRVYFIMLTVTTDKARLLQAYDAGVNDFISKPFHEGELLARVGAASRILELQNGLARLSLEAQSAALELTVANDKLEEMSRTDELTGLANRRHAMERINAMWRLAGQAKTSLTCLGIDLDGFKLVNDTLGHLAGDRVLCEVASTLKSLAREGDMVARLGGDEFIIVSQNQNPADAQGTADQICHAVDRLQMTFEGQPAHVTLSVGVAKVYPDTEDPEVMIRMADKAMYAAKLAGRNTYRLAS